MNERHIWEDAERYHEGVLSVKEREGINDLIANDSGYAAEFNECVALLRSMKDNGTQKRFRNTLKEIHKKQVKRERLSKVLHYPLTPQFWRTAAIAAGVALITSSITFSLLNNSVQKSANQYSTISREVSHIKNQQQKLQQQQAELIKTINKNAAPIVPKADARYTGTGFAISNDGYFATAYHVINDGKGDFDSVYIQNQDGEYYKAFLVALDDKADLAIMKVGKKNFHFGKGELPYTFSSAKTGLGAKIYTLGYPKDEVVYSEGYVSAKNGYQGNEMQYTLELPAGHGQSGSPVIDGKGNIVGVLSAIGTPGEANTYAVSTKELLALMKKMPSENAIHLPRHSKLANLDRDMQIEKMSAYTFSVKVYKK